MNIINPTAIIAYLFGVLIAIQLAFIAKLLWDEYIDG